MRSNGNDKHKGRNQREQGVDLENFLVLFYFRLVKLTCVLDVDSGRVVRACLPSGKGGVEEDGILRHETGEVDAAVELSGAVLVEVVDESIVFQVEGRAYLNLAAHENIVHALALGQIAFDSHSRHDACAHDTLHSSRVHPHLAVNCPCLI